MAKEPRYANFWRRLGAVGVDLVVLCPLGIGSYFAAKYGVASPWLIAILIGSQLFMLLYQITFTYRYGQTIGKMALGLIALDAKNERDTPTLLQTFLREGFMTIPGWYDVGNNIYKITHGGSILDPNRNVLTLGGIISITFIISELTVFYFDPKGRCLHDMIGGTVVIPKHLRKGA